MKLIKTMTIFGTRPEVIKLAPVVDKLRESPFFDTVLVTTGQHREMLGQALDQFGIVPDYNLDIMKAGQAISDVTVDSLRGVEKLIAWEKPDLVLVQGDTTTAFAGCLAAFYQKTKVGHVEAGLRSYDKYQPFPEEVNRALITQLADIHFVPTETAWESLRREGIPDTSIFVTGNTVIDSLFHVVNPNYQFANEELKKIIGERRLVVVTAHRRENFGQPLQDICSGIIELVKRFPDIEVVFSVHRNPKVNVPVRKILGSIERIHLVDPLSYADMANLISRCHLVLTDSGGLQEEAPALAKPVLVLRDTTERPDAVRAGLARLVGTSKHAIVTAASELLSNPVAYSSMTRGISPYGDGNAASRILAAIEYFYNLRSRRPEPFTSMLTMSQNSSQLTTDYHLSNDLFYKQLDEYIHKARRERRIVSVATIDLSNSDDKHFARAVKAASRSLRDTDKVTAIEGDKGKQLILVLPGAGEQEVIRATERLKEDIAKSIVGRRATDPVDNDLPCNDLAASFRVDIKTFNGINAAQKEPVSTLGKREKHVCY